MIYMGSKNRIARFLLPYITKYLTGERYYVEPFAGGMNMIDKIRHPFRIANDNNNYLIALWRRLVKEDYKEFFPLTITKQKYDYCRDLYNSKVYEKGNGDSDEEATLGFVGFVASYKGRFYEGGYSGTHSGIRNYIKENIRNLYRQRERMIGVEFRHGDYTSLSLPRNSVIYCDPPYANATYYATTASSAFDSEKFWEWARRKTAEGHDVLISEYSAHPISFLSFPNESPIQ